ncbi:DNA helicase ATP-dependent RecQ type [Carpediemonas membranifera]|uniref:ATP-dependent DNA helicase n=1 Tax=Carpediemonas membranifera TaxID=201153 RepID=A0A8J6EAM3_9EUKA|nr:DNA helicase ATP-dependent RecQ type [Carpediemonas membranifera]|eukprot:KAG9394900.1 DNA helicase ATP-dependent RecQ type [Carpediemonas membranifera]
MNDSFDAEVFDIDDGFDTPIKRMKLEEEVDCYDLDDDSDQESLEPAPAATSVLERALSELYGIKNLIGPQESRRMRAIEALEDFIRPASLPTHQAPVTQPSAVLAKTQTQRRTAAKDMSPALAEEQLSDVEMLSAPPSPDPTRGTPGSGRGKAVSRSVGAFLSPCSVSHAVSIALPDALEDLIRAQASLPLGPASSSGFTNPPRPLPTYGHRAPSPEPIEDASTQEDVDPIEEITLDDMAPVQGNRRDHGAARVGPWTATKDASHTPARPFGRATAPMLDDSVVERIHTTLRSRFAMAAFRPYQKEAVWAAVAGKDVFVILPTGSGKSLTYQLPAVIAPGLTVVVSPLISLIIDQVAHLAAWGIPAVHFSGPRPTHHPTDLLPGADGAVPYKVCYVTPEKIVQSRRLIQIFEQLHKDGLLDRFVIDEAHCVSNWGHDFRQDYIELAKLRQSYPDVPITALTATAAPRTKQQVIDILQLRPDFTDIEGPLYRDNLVFSVVPAETSSAMAVHQQAARMVQLRFRGMCGIIYCMSKNETTKAADSLAAVGIHALPYHAGLEAAERDRVQGEWSGGRIKVVCATTAFGMGIDRPDVRFVIHVGMALSVAGYYQAAGRAGRDGKTAECISLFRWKSKAIPEMVLNAAHSMDDGKRQHLYETLWFMADTVCCRNEMMLRHFGHDRHFQCGKCDNCKREKSDLRSIPPDTHLGIQTSLYRAVRGNDGQWTVPQLLKAMPGLCNKLKALSPPVRMLAIIYALRHGFISEVAANARVRLRPGREPTAVSELQYDRQVPLW